jgi:hypothetical protein
MYDSLKYFLNHYKSVDHVNKLFQLIGLPLLTKEDIDLLTEYMNVVQPLALVLDILQGERKVFLGLGVVLSLLTKLKSDLADTVFPHLHPIRDKMLSSIDKRYIFLHVCVVYYS